MQKLILFTSLLSVSVSIFATAGRSDDCKLGPVDPDAPCVHIGSDAALHMSQGLELLKLCELAPDGSTQLMAHGQISAQELSEIIIKEQELGFARATAIRADAASNNTIISMKSTCDSDPDIGYVEVLPCGNAPFGSMANDECNASHFLDGNAVISSLPERVSLIQVSEAQYNAYSAAGSLSDSSVHEFSGSLTGSSVNPETCDLVETQLCDSLREECRTAASAKGENWSCDGVSCITESKVDSVDSNPVSPNHTCSVEMSLTAPTIPAPKPASIPVRKATKAYSSEDACQKSLDAINGINPQFAEDDVSLRADCNGGTLEVFINTRVEHTHDPVARSGQFSSKSDCVNAQELIESIGSDELIFSAYHIPGLADSCERTGSWFDGKYMFSFSAHLYGKR